VAEDKLPKLTLSNANAVHPAPTVPSDSTIITPSAPSSTAANNKPILFNHNSRTTSGLDPIAVKDIEKTTINNNNFFDSRFEVI
jgi:hypothetical protein